MQTILLTGGTGLVGSALSALLVEKGYLVIILTRRIPSIPLPKTVRYALWDIENRHIDPWAIEESDAIIHLAGAGVVDKKWSPAYKAEIARSRTASAALLLDKLKEFQHRVKCFISASAIGYYGKDLSPVVPFEENCNASTDFLGTICRQWEESVNPVEQNGIRLVKLRIGIVLSSRGGALAEFMKPLKFGIAAVLGSGKQVISWIHLEDLRRLFLYALEQDQISGVYNAVSPFPVSNKELTTTLAREMRGKNFLLMKVPGFALRLLMGERSIEVLKSSTVSAAKIIRTGFQFSYPEIKSAVGNLVGIKDRLS